MTEPRKLDGRSQDVTALKRIELKQLFPGVVTEIVNDNGELVQAVDFERLKAELGSFTELFERRRERYGMEWPGKSDSLKVLQERSLATLKPCREESVNFDTTENLFIEGDNLEVLKLLQKSYHGQVKMIYIDPPYNTGNEFIYPDNFSESLDTYLSYAGLLDDQGRRIESNKNSRDGGRFHTKWLNMMYPRLYLARNLLRDDGVIFISIDDNELSNLRKLCDEVFGEENFVANIIWQKKYAVSNDDPGIAAMHDYILVYQKTVAFARLLLPRTKKQLNRYQNLDNDPRGLWSSDNYVSNKSNVERPTLWYPIKHPRTGEDVWPEKDAVWRYSKENNEIMVAENRLYWGPDQSYAKPRLKRFLSEIQDGVVPSTWWPFTEVGHNDEGQKETGKLLGKKIFSTPKPVRLIKKILAISASKNDIILDFFSGSCATAHAVLDLNSADSGNRKFIMVQLPEPCDEKSEAAKAGYKTIADIGKERIRRLIKQIKDKNLQDAEKDKRENPLFHQEVDSVPSVASVVQKQDLGFKVLKLDKSNFKVWQPLPADASEAQIKEALQGHLFHIDETATSESILYEILLKAGYMPSTRMEVLALAGKTVYSIAGGALFICLEDEITRGLIDAVAERLPQQFICLDRGFKGNDQLKANTVQTFSALNESKDKETRIIFRTV